MEKQGQARGNDLNLNTVNISAIEQRGSTLHKCWTRSTLGNGGVSQMGGIMRMFQLDSRQVIFNKI